MSERWKRGWAMLTLAAVLMVNSGGDSASWERCAPQPREIFSGITYGCERLERTSEGSGAIHWIKVDLGTSGIEVYLTPIDPSAAQQGWQYRLRWIDDVVREEQLAVAVNGALFSSKYWWWRLPGTLANGVETVVSEHVASLPGEQVYLLWFDDHLNPHLGLSRPPALGDLGRAKWGIGGQRVGLYDGELLTGTDGTADARTAIGIDAKRRLLYLAVAGWASPHLMLKKLAEIGARDGMLLDGGGSSALAIGEGADGIAKGTLFGGSRPVATFFGIRARPLSPAQGH